MAMALCVQQRQPFRIDSTMVDLWRASSQSELKPVEELLARMLTTAQMERLGLWKGPNVIPIAVLH